MLYLSYFKFCFLLLILIYFLQILRSNHPPAVFSAMEAIMTNVLDESEEITSDLLSPILASVRKENWVFFFFLVLFLLSSSPLLAICNTISFILLSIDWFTHYFRKRLLFHGNWEKRSSPTVLLSSSPILWVQLSLLVLLWMTMLL